MKTREVSSDHLKENDRQFAQCLFGSMYKGQRERLGLSRQEAARESGVPEAEWEAIEQGTAETVDPLMMNAIHKTLHLKRDDLATLAVLVRGILEEKTSE